MNKWMVIKDNSCTSNCSLIMHNFSINEAWVWLPNDVDDCRETFLSRSWILCATFMIFSQSSTKLLMLHLHAKCVAFRKKYERVLHLTQQVFIEPLMYSRPWKEYKRDNENCPSPQATFKLLRMTHGTIK